MILVAHVYGVRSHWADDLLLRWHPTFLCSFTSICWERVLTKICKYGQAVWFTKFHGEKVPSAVERYTNEINRVTSVLEGHLKEQKEKNAGGNGPWLVGGKMSYADLAFIPWQRLVGMMLEGYKAEEYPLVKEWLGKMTERKAVKSVFEKADH